MRHSETDWNRQGRTQGRADVELNENGKKIAILAGVGMADVPIDLCITSPLRRAYETARLVLKGNKHFIEEGSIYRTDDRLMEIDFGEWEGILATPHAGLIDWKKLDDYFRPYGATYCPKGAETVADVIRRTGDFLDHLAKDTALMDKNVFVMSHGAAMRCLLSNLSPDPDFFNKLKTPFNCEVYILDLKEDGKFEISAEHVLYYDKDLVEDLYS